MTISEALKRAVKVLNKSGVEGANVSAEFLLANVLKKDKVYLLTHAEEEISYSAYEKYKKWIGRRAKHEPVWYITGKIEFLGLEFSVNRDVLIPRPETELLIEKITEHFREGFSPKTVLDIGTGSGAIIISLANILSSRASDDCNAKFFASDISGKALAVAQKNAKSLNFDDKIEFRQGNLFESWENQKFNLIVANLPYVPESDKDTLAPDLTDYEPHLALFGGVNGLQIIRDFIMELPNHLNTGSNVFMEIGYDQGEAVKKMVGDYLPNASVSVLGDYANTDRIVIIKI